MIELTSGYWDPDHFSSVYNQVIIICDTMRDAGYAISDVEAYKAWMAGNDGVWEHPYEYDYDTDIVDSVLAHTSPWYETMDAEPYILTEDDWNDILDRMDEEVNDYEPKSNAKIEGCPF